MLTLEPVQYVSHFPFISFVPFPFSLTRFFFQHSSLLCRSRFPTLTITMRSHRRRHRAKSPSPSPCEVATTVRSRLVMVACCFCGLPLLASLSHCVIFIGEIPGLLVYVAFIVHFLHLKVSIWTLTTHYSYFVEWMKLIVLFLCRREIILFMSTMTHADI